MLLCFSSELDCRVGHLVFFVLHLNLTVGLDTWCCFVLHLSLTVGLDIWCCFVLHLSLTEVGHLVLLLFYICA